MPIFSLARSYGPRTSVRSSRGPANFGSTDMVLDASTIPVPPELMAKWQSVWNKAYDQATFNYSQKIAARVAQMKSQGYTAADIASVQASDNPQAVGYYNSILYTEMVLLGWYYDLVQDKVSTDSSSIDPSTISSNGAIVAGVWNDFAEKLIGLYQGLQQRGLNAAAGTEADTIVQQAQRIAAQVNLDIFGKILSGYSKYLTADDLSFLNFMYTDWKSPKTDSDNARLQQLMALLASKGFSYSASTAIQTKMDQIQTTVAPGATQADALYQSYKQELATNGTIDSMKMAYIQSYESIQNQVANVKVTMANTTDQGQVVSNGGSLALTAADWEGAQANQQAVTAVNDATRISPLQTAFMTATQDITQDVAMVQQQTQKNPNLALYALFGFIAYKLLRR